MPAGTVYEPRNRVSKKATWKERLTEDQLERKRAGDRQLVRESRHRTRQTIETLQEQVRLLSNQQPNKLVAELISANTALEEKQDALMHRMYGVCSALGLNKEDAHNLITQSIGGSTSTAATNSSSTQKQAETTSSDGPVAGADPGPQGEFDVQAELDSRILVPNSPSPFPSIKAVMEASQSSAPLSEEELLESIMLWQQTWVHGASVYDLARTLLHVDRRPGCITRDRLKQLAQHPRVLPRIVELLESSTTSSLPPLTLPDPGELVTERAGRSDSLVTVRREVVICAYESVRHWPYCSKVARIAMFWALYRILLLLILPTAQNLTRCPTWYRPTASQMLHDHPSFIDFIPWPHIREHLVRSWPDYLGSRIYSVFVESFDIDTGVEGFSEPPLSLNPTGTDLVLHPTIDRCLSHLSSLTAKDAFLRQFPEFASAIRPASPWPSTGLLSINSDTPALMPPLTTPPPSEPISLSLIEHNFAVGDVAPLLWTPEQPIAPPRTISTESSSPDPLAPLVPELSDPLPTITWQQSDFLDGGGDILALGDTYWQGLGLSEETDTQSDITFQGKFFIV
ncbi:hypothetical protein BDV12DRAFT_203526 [Aspergillus spectabilis]